MFCLLPLWCMLCERISTFLWYLFSCGFQITQERERERERERARERERERESAREREREREREYERKSNRLH